MSSVGKNTREREEGGRETEREKHDLCWYCQPIGVLFARCMYYLNKFENGKKKKRHTFVTRNLFRFFVRFVRNSKAYFIIITLTVPKPDANLDYSIPGRCSARDPNVPRRRCPTLGMESFGSLDRFSRIQYALDGLPQL